MASASSQKCAKRFGNYLKGKTFYIDKYGCHIYIEKGTVSVKVKENIINARIAGTDKILNTQTTYDISYKATDQDGKPYQFINGPEDCVRGKLSEEKLRLLMRGRAKVIKDALKGEFGFEMFDNGIKRSREFKIQIISERGKTTEDGNVYCFNFPFSTEVKKDMTPEEWFEWEESQVSE